jgi:hypothetical protein
VSSSVRLRVTCANASVARMLESVLAPDNVGVPGDQRFSMKRRSRTLYFEATSGRLRSPLTTLSSVLSDVTLFGEIWLISRHRGTSGRGGPSC